MLTHSLPPSLSEFAFYVNKNGWRSKGNWIIHWEGNPTSFALHYPYVLAFEPSFIEVRHVKTGALHQVITGFNLRCLFADVPAPASAPSSSSSNSSSLSVNSRVSSPSPYGGPPPPPPGQFGGYPGLQRQQSFGNMLGGPNPTPGYPPRPPVGYGPQGQVLYPTQGVPYAFTQAQAPRPPQPQRNPVWESVAASRNQIVFVSIRKRMQTIESCEIQILSTDLASLLFSSLHSAPDWRYHCILC